MKVKLEETLQVKRNIDSSAKGSPHSEHSRPAADFGAAELWIRLWLPSPGRDMLRSERLLYELRPSREPGQG